MVAEIATCLYTRRHEGNITPLGILFCKNELTREDGVEIVPMPHLPLDELRHLADGRRTFVVYSGSERPKLAVFKAAIADEVRLLALSLSMKGIVVQREGSGATRIAQNGEVWLVENRTWERKSPLVEHVTLIGQCFGSIPYSHHTSLYSLLKLAYYFLSSKKVGTTLVWRLFGPAEQTMIGLSKVGLDLTSLNLNISDESSYSIIEHVVQYHDGAVIVGPGGLIEHLGAHLSYLDSTAERVSPDKGTRHTSAKRFSFEHPETLVCAVSEDGPVSIYSDGYKVTEMAATIGSIVSEVLKRAVPAKAEDISTSSFDVTCPGCDRNIRVDEVLILGWRDNETVACPCCRFPNLFSSRCFSLSARPIKTWPDVDYSS